ncbi:MAG: sigma-70 family RNA polymerase sigma factor [Granulosicoccus sp.]|nr:sigma-70 family RNA polymerase sigma factor [Granulosicoccus sp.]
MNSSAPPPTKKNATAAAALRKRMGDNLLAIGRDRDEAAFADVYSYYAGRVKSFLMGKGMNEDTAEELTQEIMLVVWRRAESYDPNKAAASTWLFTIARNRRIDYLRGNSRIEVDLDDEMLDMQSTETDTQEKFVADEQSARQLETALASLPQEQRQVMHLSYYRGMSHGDIAQWLELPIGTVKSRIRLAIQAVRGSLKDEEMSAPDTSARDIAPDDRSTQPSQ